MNGLLFVKMNLNVCIFLYLCRIFCFMRCRIVRYGAKYMKIAGILFLSNLESLLFTVFIY